MMALHMRSSILFNIVCFGNSEIINVLEHDRVIKTMCCFWSLIVLASKENWPYFQIPTFEWLTNNYLHHATYPYNPLTIDYEHWLMVTGICKRMFSTELSGLFRIFLEVRIYLIKHITISLEEMESLLNAVKQSKLCNLVFETESKCTKINGIPTKEKDMKIISIKAILAISDCSYTMDMEKMISGQIIRVMALCSKNTANVLQNVLNKLGKVIKEGGSEKINDPFSFDIVLNSPAGEIRFIFFKLDLINNIHVKNFLLEKLPRYFDMFKFWLMLVHYTLFYWGASSNVETMVDVFKNLDKSYYGLFDKYHVDMKSNINLTLFKEKVNTGCFKNWPLPLNLDLCELITSIKDGRVLYKNIPETWKNYLNQYGVTMSSSC